MPRKRKQQWRNGRRYHNLQSLLLTDPLVFPQTTGVPSAMLNSWQFQFMPLAPWVYTPFPVLYGAMPNQSCPAQNAVFMQYQLLTKVNLKNSVELNPNFDDASVCNEEYTDKIEDECSPKANHDLNNLINSGDKSTDVIAGEISDDELSDQNQGNDTVNDDLNKSVGDTDDIDVDVLQDAGNNDLDIPLPDAECSICLGKLIKPIKCALCVNVSCWLCLDLWVSHAGVCPMCRTEIDILIEPL